MRKYSNKKRGVYILNRIKSFNDFRIFKQGYLNKSLLSEYWLKNNLIIEKFKISDL